MCGQNLLLGHIGTPPLSSLKIWHGNETTKGKTSGGRPSQSSAEGEWPEEELVIMKYDWIKKPDFKVVRNSPQEQCLS